MRVYKCDRCGKYVSACNLFDLRPPLLKKYYFGIMKKHLCNECVKSLRKWLEEPKVKEESE